MYSLLLPGVARPTVEYNVWYRLVDSKDWHTMQIKYPAVSEVTIDYLAPGKIYEFLVLSKSTYGDGVFSKPFRYFTKRHCEWVAIICRPHYNSPLPFKPETNSKPFPTKNRSSPSHKWDPPPTS